MSKVTKTMWTTLGWNTAGGVLLYIILAIVRFEYPFSAVIYEQGLALFVEFIVAIFFISIGHRRNETGKGMLAAVGVELLLGFVVCTGTFIGSLGH